MCQGVPYLNSQQRIVYADFSFSVEIVVAAVVPLWHRGISVPHNRHWIRGRKPQQQLTLTLPDRARWGGLAYAPLIFARFRQHLHLLASRHRQLLLPRSMIEGPR